MSLSKRLFRESALERLSSPEQLDQQLAVTSPRGWIALGAMWALLAAIVAWSIIDRVPTREEGHGILVAGGGLKVVVAGGTGRLRSIHVEVGQDVSPDQVVAEIEMQDIADELEQTEALLAEKRRQHERIDAFDAQEEANQQRLEAVELERLDNTTNFLAKRIVRLESRKGIVQKLVDDGMMAEIELFDVEEKIEDAQMARDRASHEREQLIARHRAASFDRHREHMTRAGEIEDLQLRAANLQSKLERESMVVCPFQGRVVEVRAAEQTTVQTGDSILLIEPAGSEAGLEAILYVSAATGQRIHENMKVHVSPSTVKREEFGSMIGTVSFVADVPTSRSAMRADLGDADLVDKLTQQLGLPLETRVTLQRADTASGYAWTSSQGPPSPVSAGTLCDGSVTIEEQRPVALLIPYARHKLGLD